MSPEKQQLIGVKVATVEKAPGSHTLRVLGRVVPDETRIYRINSATDGWVKKILPVTTDSLVQKDELLATFYAPEFFSAMQAYLFGLRYAGPVRGERKETKEQLEQTGANIENYRNSLRNLGMTEHQMDEILQTPAAVRTTSRSERRRPASSWPGTSRPASASKREPSSTGSLTWRRSGSWPTLFETEASAFKPGMPVRVSPRNLKKTFSARVANVLPQVRPGQPHAEGPARGRQPRLAPAARHVRGRRAPGQRWPPAMTVPADAVVDSGIKKTVYVDKGNGVFEPRKVETGWRDGDQVEIVKGLMPGEKIVVSGTFLIDSESRMKAAAAGITGESSECPVCGMEVDQTKAKAAGLTSEFRGQTYYFCADEDKVKFDKEPTRYAGKSGKEPATPAGKRLSAAQWEGATAKAKESPPATAPAAAIRGKVAGSSRGQRQQMRSAKRRVKRQEQSRRYAPCPMRYALNHSHARHD